MRDLTNYVNSYPGMVSAPASTDRILRKMQADGKLKYLVVNRSKSLYRINEVA
jgi:hypothetical protein